MEISPNNKICREIQDTDDLEYIAELEKEREKNMPRFTEAMLLETFGDALDTMGDKIAELKCLRKAYKRKICEIGKKYIHGDDLDSYFARKCIECFLVTELQKVEKSLFLIKRLKWQKNKPKREKWNGITSENIEKARNVSIVHLAEQHIGQLRRCGGNYIARCPFHDEKTPSFYIYSESNRFHCFGCNISGDVINFVQEITGLDFKKAIYYLIIK